MTDQPSGTQTPNVRIFGKAESAPAYAIRDFLHRGDVPFEWTELKNDEQAREVGVESALHGEEALSGIVLTNNKTSQQQTFNTKWLFLCLGGVPHTEWAKEDSITRDTAGYLVTGPDLAKDGRYPKNWPLERAPYHLETSMPGLFAAGDVRHDSVKRCASAVGEGAMAVTFVHRYLAHS